MNDSMAATAAGRAWRVGEAPGRLPLIGHLMPMLRGTLEFVDTLREHGDLVELRLGPIRAYAVCHPELVREMLRDARTYDKGGKFYDAARAFLGNGIVVSRYDEHRVQRRLVQPAFHRPRLAQYATVMSEEAASLSGAWRPGDVIDVSDAAHTAAARITFRSLFSTDAAGGIVQEVKESIILMGDGVFRRLKDPTGLYGRLPLPGNRRFDRTIARLYEIVGDLIEQRRQEGGDHGDVLSMLLAVRDEDTGAGLTDSELQDQVLNILLGGTETAATTLAWAFYLLAENPEANRRLQDEADEVLAGRPAGLDDLPSLGYTNRVLMETLRLWHPNWLLTRRTTADAVLGGHPIPAGTTILFSLHALHHDPELFTEPRRFDPDRWRPDRMAGLPQCAMAFFGGGARQCIGNEFALMEMAIVLATIAGQWQLSRVPGATMRPVLHGTLLPGPLPMTVEPRRA